MTTDLQRGSIWKRISAFLFDMILFSIVTLLFATLLSLVFGYDSKLESYNEIKTGIEETYGVSFGITESEYNTYDDAKKANYDAAYDALNQNSEAVRLYALLSNFAIMIVVFSVLVADIIMEFILPMILKDGRTLGKKIFGLCVIRPNCVKITGPVLFVRSILGKCVIETLIPVFIILLFVLGKGNIFLAILFFAVYLVNIILFFATKNHYQLHDLLSVTVVADYASQRIFETEDELIEFEKEQHEKKVSGMREGNLFSASGAGLNN